MEKDFRFKLQNSDRLNSPGDYRIHVDNVNGDEIRGRVIDGPTNSDATTGTSGREQNKPSGRQLNRLGRRGNPIITMTYYHVQVRLTKTKWVTLEKFERNADALNDVRKRAGETYPLRILRVTTKIVFESKS